jgi:hypothetical protein
MLATPAEFISRFLFRIRDDEFYGNPGEQPKPELIKRAGLAAKDVVGFASHCESFTMFAEIIDVCTAEELASKGSGIATRNATKHPRILALKSLDPIQRASIAAASAQGLAWMEDCREWIQDHSLRNQIAKRIMVAILYSVGRIKRGYTPTQLTALAKIGKSLQDMDIFVIRARDTINEITSKNPDPEKSRIV